MFSLILDLYNINTTKLINGIVVKANQKKQCCRFCMNLEAFLQHEGTGDFEWCRQTMDELCVFGTSRTSNELKSGP